MYKQKLNQIKALFNIEVKLEEMSLDNGVKIMVESFEVGFPAFAISEDGAQGALPEGPYILEDGTKFTVDAEGIIKTIGETEAPVEDENLKTDETKTQAKKMIESVVKETQFADEKIDAKKDEIKDDTKDEIKVEFSDEQKTLLSEMINEGIKSYFDELIASQKPQTSETKVETVEKKVEMKEEVKPIKHSPEKKEQINIKQYATGRRMTTKDRVFAKLYK
jgi:hypothetical protein